jgi:hypothetical protein
LEKHVVLKPLLGIVFASHCRAIRSLEGHIGIHELVVFGGMVTIVNIGLKEVFLWRRRNKLRMRNTGIFK